MIETDKDKLVEELNRLSEGRPGTKERMLEIARTLLKDHYGYLPRNKSNNGDDSLHELGQTDGTEGN